MPVLDPVVDFIELTVSGLYDAAATAIDIDAGDEHYTPTPDPAVSGQFNVLCYDGTVYAGRPQDDPNKEWFRVTAKSGSAPRLTVIRGQQGTAASTKSTVGSTYKLILGYGAKFRNDLEDSMVDMGANYALPTMSEYGAVGDGETDDYAAFAAALAAGVTHLVLPYGTYRIGTNLTFGTTVTVEMQQGAQWDPDSAKTVLINGALIAGNYRLKASGAAGTVTLGARVTHRKPRWFADSDEPGIESATSVRLSTVLNIPPRASAPATPAAGDLTVADRATWDPATLGDGGAYPVLYDGTIWKPLFPFKVVESAALDMEAGGGKTCEIAHGLAYTPAAKDIMAGIYQTAGAGTPMVRTLAILSVDATDVHVYVYQIGATTAGTEAKVYLWIRI